MLPSQRTQPLRAAIYCRLSRDDDASTSIATQEEDARAHCRLRGWEVVLVAADVGVSGSVKPEDREGFAEILAAAHQVDVIVARSVDRFSRSTAHFAAMVEALDSRGVTIADTQGQVDLTNPYGRFVTQIMVSFAELEKGTIQQRILRSRVELRQAGKWLGGAAPYGYRIVPDVGGGKRLEIDPDAAGELREVVRRVSAGVTLSAEIDRLNRTGVLSPGDLRKARRGELPPRAPGYSKWTYSALHEHLRSEVLRGYRVVGKRAERRVVRDADGLPVKVGPPLLTDDQWRRLQVALDKASQTNRRPRRKASLLLHVAWCERCDETLYYNVRYQGGKDSSIYTCPAARKVGGSPDCSGIAVSAGRLEKHVARWLLDHRGSSPFYEHVLVGGSGNPGKVDELRADVEELARVLVGLRGAAADAVARQLDARQEALEEALRAPVEAERWEARPTGRTVADEWARRDTAERRLLLLDLRLRAWVGPAKSRVWDPARVRVGVHVTPQEVAADELPSVLRDAQLEELGW